MNLTQENYFSPEAMLHFMSQSQFKQFDDCEAKAYAILNGEVDDDKECFIEGRYFEAIICGKRAEFEAEYAEQLISTRGASKGEPKANFSAVIESAEAFMRQSAFQEIVARCEQQVILTGVIAGVPFKTKIDFFDRETLSEWDAKCMRDFKRIYNEREQHYEAWYFGRGYHYQAAIERELILQNFSRAGQCGLIASTKEPEPDVEWLVFDNDVLDNALEIVKTFAPKFCAIKAGIESPERCEVCDYCRRTKRLSEPRVIIEYE